MVSVNDQATLRVSQAIAAQLKAIGINLKIKAVTPTEQIPIIIGDPKKRPVMWTPTGACSPDPSWDDLFIANGALNEANWHPKDVDDLVANGLLTQDPKKRLEIYASIQKRVAEDVPYVPLFLEGTSYASNKYDWLGFGSFWQSTRWALNLKPR
jgi:peptide/nickel transport system substrate-binding protein